MSVLKLEHPDFTSSVTGVIVSRATIAPNLLRRHFLLTGREAEIGFYITKGLTDADIASLLGIKFRTVRTHIEKMFTKLHVSNRSELVGILLRSLSPLDLRIFPK